MDKKEKIGSLSGCLITGTRGNGDEFLHFTDLAPQELKDVFLDNFEVHDLNYEIFSQSCDIIGEIYEEMPRADDEKIIDEIYERSHDRASYYTHDRLGYLTVSNEEEISDLLREYDEPSISVACAIWYDRQVEQASMLIKDWINA